MAFGLHFILAALLAQAAPLPSATPGVAPSATPAQAVRHIFILNEGNNPIFRLRVGERSAKDETWTQDLLGFDRVIDVSEAQEIDMTLDPSTCRYDMEATYRNGYVTVQRDIDLCHSARITFTY